MTNDARDCKSTVIPGLRYRDCLAAIEWLCRVLGFEKQAVYRAKATRSCMPNSLSGTG